MFIIPQNTYLSTKKKGACSYMRKTKKRSDGRYQRNIIIGKSENGRNKYKTIYARTLEELNDKVLDTKIKLKKGIDLSNKSISFGEYAIKYYKLYKADLEDKTKDMYLNIIDNHIDSLADINIDKIAANDIQECINLCFDKSNVCKKTYMFINSVFKSALDNHLVEFNPCVGIKLPKTHKSSKSRDLEPFERESLFYADLDKKVKAYLYIAAFCGLRKGEILALNVSDIDFKNNTIRVNKTRVQSKYTKAHIKNTPKTESSIRTVDMISLVADALREYISTIDSELLFTNNKGEIMSDSSFKKFWQRKVIRQLNEYYGYERITTLTGHMLRHEFSTNLFYSGVDELEAQMVMGHASINTTRAIYTHLRMNERSGKNKMDKYVDNMKNRLKSNYERNSDSRDVS